MQVVSIASGREFTQSLTIGKDRLSEKGTRQIFYSWKNGQSAVSVYQVEGNKAQGDKIVARKPFLGTIKLHLLMRKLLELWLSTLTVEGAEFQVNKISVISEKD